MLGSNQYVSQCVTDLRPLIMWSLVVVGALFFVGLLVAAPLAQANGLQWLPISSMYSLHGPLRWLCRCSGLLSGDDFVETHTRARTEVAVYRGCTVGNRLCFGLLWNLGKQSPFATSDGRTSRGCLRLFHTARPGAVECLPANVRSQIGKAERKQPCLLPLNTGRNHFFTKRLQHTSSSYLASS